MMEWPEVDVEENLDTSPLNEHSLPLFTNRVLEALFALEGRSLRLSVHYCGDSAMRTLHEQWLGDPCSTDVMSFPLDSPASGEFAQGESVPGEQTPEKSRQLAEGELLVCLDHARVQAVANGNPFINEVALYLVHGALHLLGYDDHEAQDLERMKASEARVLKQLALRVEGRHHES